MDALSGVTAGPSVGEQVYVALRSLVLSGDHPPGAHLSEVALARQLEVSRAPVREALERLAQEGLVVRIPRRGAFVRRYGAGEVRQLMELRRILETAASTLAVDRASDEAVAEVRSLLLGSEQAVTRGEAYPADKDFHLAITALSGNREVVRAAAMVYDQLRLARTLAARRSGRAQQAWSEHAAILNALEARDRGAVEEAVVAHLRAAESTMLASIDEVDAGNDAARRGTSPAWSNGRSR